MVQESAGRNLSSIQCLRGIAALMVVFHHYVGTSVQRGFAIPGLEGAAVGNAGVDIFFVISGFIMEYTAGARDYRSGDRMVFIVRRIIRIIPLYWMLTTVAYLAAIFLKGAVGLRPTLDQFLRSLVLLPGASESGRIGYVIPMAWTLAYEFYFYLIFALLLGVGARIRLIALAIFFLVSALVGAVFIPADPLLGIATNPLLLEFLAGCILAQLMRNGVSLHRPWAVTLVLAAIAAFVIELKWETSDSVIRLLIWGVPAAALVYGSVLARGGMLSTAAMALGHVGDISYSLYLSHFFVISLFVKLYASWAKNLVASPWIAAAGLFAFCLLAAHFCYVVVERPSRAWLQQRFDAWRQRVAALESINPG